MIYPKEFPIQQSERLILRKVTKADIDDIFEIYSSEEVAEFDDFEPLDSKEGSLKIIEGNHKQFDDKDQIRWMLEAKDTHELIGTCGLYDFDECSNNCTLGYDLKVKEWNKGFITEAINIVTKYAFDTMKLHRVMALVTPGNKASERVLEKNGYVYEGLMREMEYYKGQYWDGLIYAIIRKDYEKL